MFLFIFYFLIVLKKTENKILNKFTFPAYVINLPNDAGRLKNISIQLKNLEIPFKIFNATIGASLRRNGNDTNFKFPKLDPEIKYDFNSKKLRTGELGCWMSHLQVLLSISRENSTNPILILEDDSKFVDNFMPIMEEILSSLKVKNDWDYLRVGYCPNNVVWSCDKEEKPVASKHCKLRKSTRFAGAHAYFVNGSSGAKKLFDMMNTVDGKVIDLEMISGKYGTTVYASRKKLVYQDQSFKSNSNNIPCT